MCIQSENIVIDLGTDQAGQYDENYISCMKFFPWSEWLKEIEYIIVSAR